jgi:hypothetical protein
VILPFVVFSASSVPFANLKAQVSPVEMSSGIKPAEDMNRPFIVNGSDSRNESQAVIEAGSQSNTGIIINQEIYNKRMASARQALDLRLFSANELQKAYNEVQVLYLGLSQFSEAANIKTYRSRLFSDRGQDAFAQQCMAYWETYYGAQDANTGSADKKDYTRTLIDLLGNENYQNLRFCLAYIGFEMSDAFLYKAYFAKKDKFATALFTCKDISVRRLPAYFLALDIEYGLCKSLDPSNFTKQ